jgi:hypothetical protein
MLPGFVARLPDYARFVGAGFTRALAKQVHQARFVEAGPARASSSEASRIA